MRKVFMSSYLGILRIVAAFLVFFHHVRIFTENSFMTQAHFPIRTCAWAGVWVFFILGGFLSGKGFAEGRYHFNKDSIITYWKRRVKKVYFPTICFIFIIALFVFPDFVPQNPSVLISFITCTYRGNPGVDGIGATWYVFVTMWFYFLSPFVAMGLKKLERKGLYAALGILILTGLVFRTAGYHFGWNWGEVTYYPVYANADLFFSGMIISFIINKKPDTTKRDYRILQYSSIILLFITILVDDWFMNEWELGIDHRYLVQYFFPTVFIVVVLFYVYAFEAGKQSDQTVEITPISKRINIVSNYTFEFYLFHSIVLNRIHGLFHFEMGGGKNFMYMVITCFVITCILSIGFKKVFKTAPHVKY